MCEYRCTKIQKHTYVQTGKFMAYNVLSVTAMLTTGIVTGHRSTREPQNVL